jgi:hypothetical protein
MSNAAKKKLVKGARGRSAKAFLLPMARADADAMILQVRLAFEAARSGRSGRREAAMLVQSVIFTRLLTEAGFGLLEPSTLGMVEGALLALLDQHEAKSDWNMPPPLIEALTPVINEHDRQLRDVRFGAIVDATERLQYLISVRPERLSLHHVTEHTMQSNCGAPARAAATQDRRS